MKQPHEFTGQCQCGHVHYSVTGQALTLFACHCLDCQRQSGSAFGMAFWIKVDELTISKGKTKSWKRKMSDGKHMHCQFCPECGCRLFHQIEGQEHILSIKPGTLDHHLHLPIAAHIWTNRAWVEPDPDSLHYPFNPDNFDDMSEAWQALLKQARS